MIFSQEIFNIESFKRNQKDKKYLAAKLKIRDLVNSNSFGFLDDLNNKDYNEINNVLKKLKKFDNVLFLGTGGSSLGGKTLVSLVKNFFYNSTQPKVFFLENVDFESIGSLLDNVDLNKTACVVISKSGETIETISQFFLIENKFRKIGVSMKKRIFIITEMKNSTLKDIQEKMDLIFLEHSRAIGGRYSVFSIVGLLPAALVGFDIQNFCHGAQSFIKKIFDDKFFDDVFLPVLSIIKLNEKDVNMSVMMPYIDSLNELSFWYRQLWAESIGKDKKGITPINALGTVDQHSQLQLYLDGPEDKFFTILAKKFRDTNNKIDCKYSNKSIYKILHKQSLEKLLFCEMRATVKTLHDNKKPMRLIILDSLKEENIGFLMMFFIIETILGCFLMNVNPFNQPAVEQGKKLAKIYLEKNE